MWAFFEALYARALAAMIVFCVMWGMWDLTIALPQPSSQKQGVPGTEGRLKIVHSAGCVQAAC